MHQILIPHPRCNINPPSADESTVKMGDSNDAVENNKPPEPVQTAKILQIATNNSEFSKKSDVEVNSSRNPLLPSADSNQSNGLLIELGSSPDTQNEIFNKNSQVLLPVQMKSDANVFVSGAYTVVGPFSANASNIILLTLPNLSSDSCSTVAAMKTSVSVNNADVSDSFQSSSNLTTKPCRILPKGSRQSFPSSCYSQIQSSPTLITQGNSSVLAAPPVLVSSLPQAAASVSSDPNVPRPEELSLPAIKPKERHPPLRKILRPLYKYIKNQKCLLCGFESKAKDPFRARQHLLVHVKKRNFKCNICEKSFTSEKYMLNHRLRHTDDCTYPCDMCDKKFRDRSALCNHKARVHLQKQKCKCDICHKVFSSGLTLRVHLRLHTGEKPYVCSICKEAFRTSNDVRAHSRRQHGSLTPFHCPQCSKAFANKSSLNNHVRSHDGNNADD